MFIPGGVELTNLTEYGDGNASGPSMAPTLRALVRSHSLLALLANDTPRFADQKKGHPEVAFFLIGGAAGTKLIS